MKFFVIVLLIFFVSCEKPAMDKPAQKFTATVSLSPSKTTLHYDVFVSNDKNYWVTIKNIKRSEIQTKTFSFDFVLEPFWCNGNVAVDPAKKLYGAVRETKADNIVSMLADSCISIHN